MPARNAIKIYVTEGVYHAYNRGVEKRRIFLDEQDYEFFRWLLKRSTLRMCRRYGPGAIQVRLYCLMPNHFHILLQQGHEKAIEGFMRSLISTYVAYFNQKYDRVGSLFQGPYKAILIKTDDQLQAAKAYIRENPVKAGLAEPGQPYRYSAGEGDSLACSRARSA